MLDETGITFYPGGWEEWSDAVDKMLTEHNVNIDIVFTNEIKDVENYKKYFKKLQNINDNFEVLTTDVDRDEVHISATEIRKNPEKNKMFLTVRGKHYLIFSLLID